MKDRVPADKCDWYQVRHRLRTLWLIPPVFLVGWIDMAGMPAQLAA